MQTKKLSIILLSVIMTTTAVAHMPIKRSKAPTLIDTCIGYKTNINCTELHAPTGESYRHFCRQRYYATDTKNGRQCRANAYNTACIFAEQCVYDSNVSE